VAVALVENKWGLRPPLFNWRDLWELILPQRAKVRMSHLTYKLPVGKSMVTALSTFTVFKLL
jgi:hypothetical protein